MALIQWCEGGAQGDWSDVDNWDLGRLPQSGDDVLIAKGSQAINANLSHGSVVLNSLKITFAGTIGSDATPLTISVPGDSGDISPTVLWTGKGAFIKIAAGSSGITKLVSAPRSNGTCYLASGSSIFQVEAGRNGRVEIDSGCEVSTIKTAGAGIVVAAAATDIDLFIAAKGSHQLKRNVQSLAVHAGATVEGQISAAVDSLLVTGGRYVHRSSGTIGLSEVMPGGIASADDNPYAYEVTDRITWTGGYNFDKESLAGGVGSFPNPNYAVAGFGGLSAE